MNPLGVTVWNVEYGDGGTVSKTTSGHTGLGPLPVDTRPTWSFPTDLPPPQPAERLMLWGQRYWLRPSPARFHYELDASDEQAQVLAVQRKESPTSSRFTHGIQTATRRAVRDSTTTIPGIPALFLHKCIDNGAICISVPAITRCGHRNLQGPVRSSTTGETGVDLVRQPDSPPNSANLTRTEAANGTPGSCRMSPRHRLHGGIRLPGRPYRRGSHLSR